MRFNSRTPTWSLFHTKTFETLKGFLPAELEGSSALVPIAHVDPSVVGSKICLGVKGDIDKLPGCFSRWKLPLHKNL